MNSPYCPAYLKAQGVQILDPVPAKSVGHIAFYGGFEYLYIGGNNSVYRAPISNPMEKTPYGNVRTGARFESTMRAWERSPVNASIQKEVQIPPECRICGEQCTAKMREQCFREWDL